MPIFGRKCDRLKVARFVETTYVLRNVIGQLRIGPERSQMR
jgi:hypothetical protein